MGVTGSYLWEVRGSKEEMHPRVYGVYGASSPPQKVRLYKSLCVPRIIMGKVGDDPYSISVTSGWLLHSGGNFLNKIKNKKL